MSPVHVPRRSHGPGRSCRSGLRTCSRRGGRSPRRAGRRSCRPRRRWRARRSGSARGGRGRARRPRPRARSGGRARPASESPACPSTAHRRSSPSASRPTCRSPGPGPRRGGRSRATRRRCRRRASRRRASVLGLGGKRVRNFQLRRRLISRSFSTRFGSFLDERSSLGANSKRGCFPFGNRFENTNVEATLNHPFPALMCANAGNSAEMDVPWTSRP